MWVGVGTKSVRIRWRAACVKSAFDRNGSRQADERTTDDERQQQTEAKGDGRCHAVDLNFDNDVQ